MEITMNYENEITVKVNTTYDKLHDILLKNNFIIKEEYTVKDTYMINKEINITKLNDLELLKIESLNSNSSKCEYIDGVLKINS